MDIALAIFLLIVLGMVNHQVAMIVTQGVIFEDFRLYLWDTFPGKFAYLFTCHLCLGTWVGFVQAALFRIELGTGSPLEGALVAFSVAMVGRGFNELLAVLASVARKLSAE